MKQTNKQTSPSTRGSILIHEEIEDRRWVHLRNVCNSKETNANNTTKKQTNTSGNWDGGRSKEGGLLSWWSLFLWISHQPTICRWKGVSRELAILGVWAGGKLVLVTIYYLAGHLQYVLFVIPLYCLFSDPSTCSTSFYLQNVDIFWYVLFYHFLW